MHHQQPPAPAVVIVTDEALELMWAPHDEALAKAQGFARRSAQLQQTAADLRNEAHISRQDAERARQEWVRLEGEAAELEARATQAVLDANFQEQEKEHQEDVARDVAGGIECLRALSNKEHPEARVRRLAEQAAANAAGGAGDPLTGPLPGTLVSASPEPPETVRFPAPAGVDAS